MQQRPASVLTIRDFAGNQPRSFSTHASSGSLREPGMPAALQQDEGAS